VIVVDASVVIEFLLNTDASPRVAKRLFDRGETLHAPHLVDLEMAQVFRRYERAGALPATRAESAFEDLHDMAIVRYPHDFLLPRVWTLRRNVTAYDAVYLALAEALDATLVTRDAALGSVKNHSARVEVLR
jgi:predicted nucleic acid-binding protein